MGEKLPTDEERREVARRLRKAIGLTEFAEVLGFNWTDDSDWGWKDVSSLVADLIEPSCDRDALLALADKMSRYASLRKSHGMDVDTMAVMAWVHRIREALGVSDHADA